MQNLIKSHSSIYQVISFTWLFVTKISKCSDICTLDLWCNIHTTSKQCYNPLLWKIRSHDHLLINFQTVLILNWWVNHYRLLVIAALIYTRTNLWVWLCWSFILEGKIRKIINTHSFQVYVYKILLSIKIIPKYAHREGKSLLNVIMSHFTFTE